MDFIIVGAGPGGCACARSLIEQGYSVLLLERSDSGNNDLEGGLASKETIMSSDDIPYELILGMGRGGGTNHHGLQYIDHTFVEQKVGLQAYYKKANTYMKPASPGTFQNDSNGWTTKLKSIFPEIVENKVYSRDLKMRYTAYELLNTVDHIIQYKEVLNIVMDNNMATGVTTTTSEFIPCTKGVILAAGAIHTPRILLRSSIATDTTGRGLMDHLGNYFVYVSDQELNEEVSYMQLFSEDLSWQVYFTVANKNTLYVTCAQAGILNKNGLVNEKDVYLRHTEGDVDPIAQINAAYNYVHIRLTNAGFTKTSEGTPFSIYHYHGSCSESVDNYKVKGTSNVYISDLSGVDVAIPGSTSATSLAIGFKVADIITEKFSPVLNIGSIDFQMETDGDIHVGAMYIGGKRAVFTGAELVVDENSTRESTSGKLLVGSLTSKNYVASKGKVEGLFQLPADAQPQIAYGTSELVIPLDKTLSFMSKNHLQTHNVNDKFVYTIPTIGLIYSESNNTVFLAQCTHQGFYLSGFDSNNISICTRHGSRFDANGNVVSGPASRPLKRYEAQKTTDSLVIDLATITPNSIVDCETCPVKHNQDYSW